MLIRIHFFHWKEGFEKIRLFLIDLYHLANFLKSWLPIRFENRKYDPCCVEYQEKEYGTVKVREEHDDIKNISKIVSVSI